VAHFGVFDGKERDRRAGIRRMKNGQSAKRVTWTKAETAADRPVTNPF